MGKGERGKEGKRESFLSVRVKVDAVICVPGGPTPHLVPRALG